MGCGQSNDQDNKEKEKTDSDNLAATPFADDVAFAQAESEDAYVALGDPPALKAGVKTDRPMPPASALHYGPGNILVLLVFVENEQDPNLTWDRATEVPQLVNGLKNSLPLLAGKLGSPLAAVTVNDPMFMSITVPDYATKKDYQDAVNYWLMPSMVELRKRIPGKQINEPYQVTQHFMDSNFQWGGLFFFTKYPQAKPPNGDANWPFALTTTELGFSVYNPDRATQNPTAQEQERALAHEFLHQFGALDEDSTKANPGVKSQHGGVYGTPNTRFADTPLGSVPADYKCMMRYINDDAFYDHTCNYTAWQVGIPQLRSTPPGLMELPAGTRPGSKLFAFVIETTSYVIYLFDAFQKMRIFKTDPPATPTDAPTLRFVKEITDTHFSTDLNSNWSVAEGSINMIVQQYFPNSKQTTFIGCQFTLDLEWIKVFQDGPPKWSSSHVKQVHFDSFFAGTVGGKFAIVFVYQVNTERQRGMITLRLKKGHLEPTHHRQVLDTGISVRKFEANFKQGGIAFIVPYEDSFYLQYYTWNGKDQWNKTHEVLIRYDGFRSAMVTHIGQLHENNFNVVRFHDTALYVSECAFPKTYTDLGASQGFELKPNNVFAVGRRLSGYALMYQAWPENGGTTVRVWTRVPQMGGNTRVMNLVWSGSFAGIECTELATADVLGIGIDSLVIGDGSKFLLVGAPPGAYVN